MSVEINLFDYQTPHYDRLLEILKHNHGYIDGSSTGLGKTILTLAIAKTLGYKILLIGPLAIFTQWEIAAKKFGVEIVDTISYQSLRGVSKTNLNHGYLMKIDDNYFCTKKYINLLLQDILLVFDEVHNLKNDSTAQISSAHELVKGVLYSTNFGSKSRVALLSATPFDKEIHTFSILKMVGVCVKEKLYNFDHSTNIYQNEAFLEIYDYCSKKNPDVTKTIINDPKIINRTNVNKITFTLFKEIIKKEILSCMKNDYSRVKDIKNAYYNMPEEDIKLLNENYLNLKQSLRFDGKNIKITNESFGNITTALICLEQAKLRTIIRLAQEKLDENKTNKVIIYLNYKGSMNFVKDNMKSYNPKMLHGGIKLQDREQLVYDFQQPNNNQRLIISHPKVGGIGINLDDTDGKFVRYLFISPSYYFIDLHQCTGRIFRANTKSDGKARFIYSKSCPNELIIINALANKAKVTRDSISNGENIKYPGEYEAIEEKGNNGTKTDIPNDYKTYYIPKQIKVIKEITAECLDECAED